MTDLRSISDNKAGLTRLMQMYEKDILNLCCMLLHDIALAEDAVQETFFKAYKGLDAFRGDSAEKTWLMRIAIKNDHHSRGVYPLTLPNQLFGVITTAYQHLQKGCAVKHPHHTLQSKSCKG